MTEFVIKPFYDEELGETQYIWRLEKDSEVVITSSKQFATVKSAKEHISQVKKSVSKFTKVRLYGEE